MTLEETQLPITCSFQDQVALGVKAIATPNYQTCILLVGWYSSYVESDGKIK